MADDIAKRDSNFMPALLGQDETTGEVRAVKANADGEILVTGSATIAPDTSVQKIKVSKAGVEVGERQEVNLIEGSGASLTVTDNAVDNRVDVTVAVTGGSGSMTTVKSNGTQVGGADIVTLDFSSDFGVTEDPDTEINLTLANKTGADTDLVTGTAGTNGNLVQWNADGDAVDSTITGTSVYRVGGTDVAVADGGTGASTESDARTNLGLAIGTNVQAHDADLDAVAGLASNGLITRTGAGTASARSIAVTSSTGLSVTNGDGVSGNPTLAGLDASDTVKGVVELATAAETTTGTDATRAVTPDGLAGSNYGKRVMGIAVVESDTAVTVANGKIGIPITAELNGYNIVGAQANVYTKGVTGATDIQIRRQRGASDVDVLSTKITIGDEYFAADGVINTSNDDLATGDMIFVDVDAIHSGTAPNGLSVVIIAQLP